MGFVSSVTTRGFTGHEQLDSVGLAHMNGRVYDPLLGRFLSADPHIQSPANPQSLNRYTYVNNNPLSYTDPSGYFFKKLFKKVKKFVKKYWKPIVAVALAAVTGGLAFSAIAPSGMCWAPSVILKASIAAGAAGGATFGATLTALNGGRLKDIFKAGLTGGIKGAVSGGLFGGIAGHFGNVWNLSRVAANGVAGGVMSRVNGGKFADGMKFSLAVSMLTYGNYNMRKAAVRNSSLNKYGHNIDGDSAGFFGDFIKLAGARRTVDPLNPQSYLRCDSLMGGCQGAPIRPDDVRSSFFGFKYDPESMADKINESFAGPHDWFRNLTGSYDVVGNSRHFIGSRAAIDNLMNYTLVAPAAPFAVGALVTTNSGVTSAVYQYQYGDR